MRVTRKRFYKLKSSALGGQELSSEGACSKDRVTGRGHYSQLHFHHRFHPSL